MKNGKGVLRVAHCSECGRSNSRLDSDGMTVCCGAVVCYGNVSGSAGACCKAIAEKLRLARKPRKVSKYVPLRDEMVFQFKVVTG